MKFKRVLASVLSAAMILASVPGTGLSAYAAGNGELEIVDDVKEPDAAGAELMIEEDTDEPDVTDGERIVEEVEDIGNAADDVLTSTQGYENLSLTTGEGGTVVVETGCAQSGAPGTNVLDNNTGTRWHTTWSTDNIGAGNAWINFKLNTPSTVAGLLYKVEASARNGYVKIAQVFVKVSGSEEFQKVYETSAQTPWTKTDAGQEVVFTPVENVTEVKFAALQSYGAEANRHINAVEMRVMTLPEAAETVTAAARVEDETMGSAYVDIPSAVMNKTSISVLPGVQVKYEAVENEGYAFVGWKNSEGNIVSTAREYVQAVNENTEYTAVFKVRANQLLEIKQDTIYANSWANTGNDGPASYAFNRNTGNWWHSRYSTAHGGGENTNGPSASNPIYIQAGFDGAKDVTRIVYRSRTDTGSTGNVMQDYEIFAAECEDAQPSDDQFVSVMKGRIQNPSRAKEEIIDLPCVVHATHIRIQVTSVNSGTYVTASKIEMYEDTSEDKDVHHIISIADKVSSNNAEMGTASVSPSKIVERLDTQVTLTVAANAGYVFERWNVTGDVEAPTGASGQVTLNSENDTHFEAVFREVNKNNEAEYWDAERAAGTLGTQTAEDIWHYQIKVNGLWSDIPSSAYYDTSDSNNKWLQNGDGSNDTYYYAKIGRDELTSTFSNDSQQALGYAWKATESGYYYATLQNNISAGGSRKMDLVVTHTASNMLQEDGETLLTQEVGNGENFTSRIARAEAGDYIRIGVRKKDAWVQGFIPVIVPVTVKEYAEQYVADVETILETDPYTAESTAAVTEAKENLKAAIASESGIEEKLTELENAVNTAVMKADEVNLTATALTEGAAVPTVTIPEDASYTLDSYRWLLDGTEVTEYVDGTKNLTLEAVLSTSVSEGFSENVEANLNGAPATVEKQADGTLKVTTTLQALKKEYTAEKGLDIPEEDLAFYNGLHDLTITLTGKMGEGSAQNKNYAMFTLEGVNDAGVQQYFTVWYNPGKGRLCYHCTGMPGGVFWSDKVPKLQADKNFKFSFALTKLGSENRFMLYTMNGENGNIDGPGYANMNTWDKFVNEFLENHSWTVQKVTIGKAPANVTPPTIDENDGTAVQDFIGSVDRVSVYNGYYGSEATGLIAHNNETTPIYYNKLKDLRDSVNELSAEDYTTESWAAVQTALTTANAITDSSRDWLILDAYDALKAAIEGLVAVPRYTVTVNSTLLGSDYKFGQLVEVTAEAAPEGQKFVGWKDLNTGKIVAFSAEYGFYVVGNMNLEAVYAAESEEVTKEIALSCIASYDAINNIFTAKRNIPADGGYTLVAHGVVVTTSEEVYNDCVSKENGTASLFERGKTGVKRSQGTSTDLNGTYVLKLRRITNYIYARAYVTYEKDGVQQTIYSAPVAVQYNE